VVALTPAGSDEHRCALDGYDRGLLKYVVQWAPYGGPPNDEILSLFGILYYEVPSRVREIIEHARRRGTTASDHTLLVDAALAINSVLDRRSDRETT
jgi:hypothetical protein